MINYKIKWKKEFKNSVTVSNIVLGEEDNIIFSYNEYVDEILHERSIGKLISLSLDGEENWEFSFPDNNYLYFASEITVFKNSLYIIADSNQEYDNGYERGLYAFDINGSFKWYYHFYPNLGQPIVDDKGNIYVLDRAGDIHFVSLNGKLINIINAKDNAVLIDKDTHNCSITESNSHAALLSELESKFTNEQIKSKYVKGSYVFYLTQDLRYSKDDTVYLASIEF